MLHTILPHLNEDKTQLKKLLHDKAHFTKRDHLKISLNIDKFH